MNQIVICEGGRQLHFENPCLFRENAISDTISERLTKARSHKQVPNETRHGTIEHIHSSAMNNIVDVVNSRNLVIRKFKDLK